MATRGSARAAENVAKASGAAKAAAKSAMEVKAVNEAAVKAKAVLMPIDQPGHGDQVAPEHAVWRVPPKPTWIRFCPHVPAKVRTKARFPLLN